MKLEEETGQITKVLVCHTKEPSVLLSGRKQPLTCSLSQLRFTLQKGHSVCYVPGILGGTGEWPRDRDKR